MLGIIAGLTELIPVLGPISARSPAWHRGGVPPATGLPLVLKVLLVYMVVQQLENNLLVPKIQGDSVKLHPAIILLVLVMGGQVAGLIGPDRGRAGDRHHPRSVHLPLRTLGA